MKFIKIANDQFLKLLCVFNHKIPQKKYLIHIKSKTSYLKIKNYFYVKLFMKYT